jgi:hypothetical protein
LDTIEQIDKEYHEQNIPNQMKQIAQISQSLSKQLKRCENIELDENDVGNANIFDDRFLEDQLKQIDERTKSLTKIETKVFSS